MTMNGKRFYVTATHATAAVASKAAPSESGARHYITGITVSSDKVGAIGLIKTGTTVIWQFQVGAGVHSIQFTDPLVGDAIALVSVEIDGASACKANIMGFTL